MIRHILFDMGQVLIRFDQRFFIQRLGIDGEDMELLMREIFRSVEWVQMDRGTIREEEAFRRISARLPERLHEAAGKLIAMWDRPILEIEGMYELVEELKDLGYGIYLLSNASLRQHEYWPRVPASRFFDGTIISADEKIMKPHPDYFRRAMEKFGLLPRECFFVDDQPANVEGALFCGISGAVFHNDAGLLRRAMREAGIPVKE